jgi:hypothetical protein
MAERGKKEKQKRSSEMSSEEIEKYFKDKGIDIQDEIQKLRRVVLLHKRIFEEEKKGGKKPKKNTEITGITETGTFISDEGKGEEKENVNGIGDTRVEFRMACNGMYGEDGVKIE